MYCGGLALPHIWFSTLHSCSHWAWGCSGALPRLPHIGVFEEVNVYGQRTLQTYMRIETVAQGLILINVGLGMCFIGMGGLGKKIGFNLGLVSYVIFSL